MRPSTETIGTSPAENDVPQGAHFPLLCPTEAPMLGKSSPHLMGFEEFAEAFGGSLRRDLLLDRLRASLRQLETNGLSPLCLLIGGGFTRCGDAPNDIDGLVAYSLKPDAPADWSMLLRRRVEGLDLRYVPADVHPALLIRMSCFFHTLYQSRNRSGDGSSFLITWDGG